MAEKLRLQKYFSDCGILSRRKAEEEIAAGRVKVNGSPAFLGDRVDPSVDLVEYRGERVLPRRDGQGYRYLLLNKPRGYLCTLSDDRGRKTVVDLLGGIPSRLWPVGRLDMDSEGLLLLTDDGELTNRLTHPKHEIPKIYEVTYREPVTPGQIEKLSSPMELDGYPLRKIGIEAVSDTVLRLTLWEGRNRQIRRMSEIAGMKVARLQRVAIGSIRLGSLPLGKWRDLTGEEVEYLKGNVPSSI